MKKTKEKTMRTDTKTVIWAIAVILFYVGVRILAFPFVLDAKKLAIIEKQNIEMLQWLLFFAGFLFLALVSRKTLENILGKGLMK